MTVAPEPELEVHAGGAVDWRYAARVEVPPAASTDALTWARASFEGAPRAMRSFLVVGWLLLLLDGSPRSDASHVLGWLVTHNSPGVAVLRRSTPLGIRATLVFTAGDHTATFASAMIYTNRLGRVLWAAVAPVHRWAVRYLLTHAARIATRNRAS